MTKHASKLRLPAILALLGFLAIVTFVPAGGIAPPPDDGESTDAKNNPPDCDDEDHCDCIKCPEFVSLTSSGAPSLVARKCELSVSAHAHIEDGAEHRYDECDLDYTNPISPCVEWTVEVGGSSDPHIVSESKGCRSCTVVICNNNAGDGYVRFTAVMPSTDCCDQSCPGATKSVRVDFEVADLVDVRAEPKGQGETYYMANDYLDEPDKREEKQKDIRAILDPDMDPDCLTWEWDHSGKARIVPVHSKDAIYYVTDHGCTRFIRPVLESSGCGRVSKEMYMSVEGVDMATTIPAPEETTKPYNIFLNENFDQGLGPYDDPTCYEVDHSDETYPGDAMDELGQIPLIIENCDDADAVIKFEGAESLIHLFKTPTSLIEFGTWYPVSELPSVLYVEGINIGEATLTSTIKTQDDWEGEDEILIKSIQLDLDMITIPPDSDKEEICSEQCVIYVNNDDDNTNGVIDLSEDPVEGEDDLFELLLDVSPDLTEEDVNGPVCFADIPGNVKLWKDSFKNEEATCYSVTSLPVSVYVEGLAPSGDLLDTEIKVELELNSGVMCRDSVKLTILKVDLDAMKVSHNTANGELPDSDETSPGAFVPINNDDDDYDASNTADKDQSGSITGESDLLPIKLHKVDPVVTGSKYTLDIPTQVKIWQNSDRSGAVTGTTEFDANVDTTLYVEGITAGSGNIKINWKDGTTTLDDCDEIKVTVFDWLGPLNVPDYSIHQYTASGALGSSQWTTPVNGTIKTGSGTSDITILWNGGPVIGKAVYQVNANYLWDLEVNVVEVKIENPSAGNPFAAGAPSYAGNINFGVLGPVVSSGAPGMRWRAKVTMNGPTANAVNNRGVTHVEVGFVQNLTFTTCRGDYTVGGVAQSLSANIQGNSYHDKVNGLPAGTVYYATGGSYTFKPAGTSAAARTIDPLWCQDTPTAGVPLYYKKGLVLNPPNDDTLDSMHWTGTFDLWITARTDDSRNSADDIYTCRASGDWTFNVNEAYPMANPLAGSNVTVPAAWTAITDGSTPTLTTGQTANQALAGITY